MSDPLLIYGSTGYTGRLIAEEACRRGLRPILAGRNEQKVRKVATTLGLEHRAATLDDVDSLARLLHGVSVVLQAAGPFSETSAPMVEACLRAGVHYLDVTGEVDVLEQLAARDAAARARGILVLPGIGFDVVPSDCLAAHVVARQPRTARLAIGITPLDYATRGSAKTIIEHVGRGIPIRRAGRLECVAPGTMSRSFDFGKGPESCVLVPWGDVTSAWHTTGVPDIEVYFAARLPVVAMLSTSAAFGWLLRSDLSQAWLKAMADVLPDTPPRTATHSREMVIVAEAIGTDGAVAASRLRTPEAYAMTGVLAAAIAERVLREPPSPGFRTPARLFGADFVMSFPGVQRTDVDRR